MYPQPTGQASDRSETMPSHNEITVATWSRGPQDVLTMDFESRCVALGAKYRRGIGYHIGDMERINHNCQMAYGSCPVFVAVWERYHQR